MPAVVLNGTDHELPDGATVSDAVLASGAAPNGRGVAVAVDGEVVPRARWSTQELATGGQVEVLHAVQGG